MANNERTPVMLSEREVRLISYALQEQSFKFEKYSWMSQDAERALKNSEKAEEFKKLSTYVVEQQKAR